MSLDRLASLLRSRDVHDVDAAPIPGHGLVEVSYPQQRELHRAAPGVAEQQSACQRWQVDSASVVLGIALTIGVRRAIPQSVNEAFDSQIATPPTVSPDGTRAEHFAHVVDGRLADLFEGIAETYDKARTDGERQLVVSILSGTATSLSSCLASMVGFGDPPIQSVTPIEELDR